MNPRSLRCHKQGIIQATHIDPLCRFAFHRNQHAVRGFGSLWLCRAALHAVSHHPLQYHPCAAVPNRHPGHGVLCLCLIQPGEQLPGQHNHATAKR